ncbi:MAG: 2TM domain-containing protein [Myxococcota bacterium]
MSRHRDRTHERHRPGGPGLSPPEILADVLEAVRGRRQSPEERLVRKARAKERGWKGHLRAFSVVNAGLVALNVLTEMSQPGAFEPWSLYVIVSWGMGMGLHTLGYLGWKKEHAEEIARAEEVLDEERLMEAGVEHATGAASDPAWAALRRRCREAVKQARAALAPLEDAEQPRLQLESGLQDMERLVDGATRIRGVLLDLAPGGVRELDATLAELDERVARADDPRLQQVYETNRDLLAARRRKVRMLEDELTRMKASAEGFALAAENVRLDAARLDAAHLPALGDHLAEPVERLGEEVEILRQVEEELETLPG